jgi:8-oxo-dGTP diphosphatase
MKVPVKPPLAIPAAAWALVKEVARHLLRRPVVGVAVAGQTDDGRWLLIRRGDTGEWALPGGTLEWGETLTHAAERELREEAGARLRGPLTLSGVYSDPDRDMRFHSVTVLLQAEVSAPDGGPQNPLEIREVGLFHAAELPARLSHRMTDMLRDARSGRRVVE